MGFFPASMFDTTGTMLSHHELTIRGQSQKEGTAFGCSGPRFRQGQTGGPGAKPTYSTAASSLYNTSSFGNKRSQSEPTGSKNWPRRSEHISFGSCMDRSAGGRDPEHDKPWSLGPGFYPHH